jgi:single-strand DNA-binding protein
VREFLINLSAPLAAPLIRTVRPLTTYPRYDIVLLAAQYSKRKVEALMSFNKIFLVGNLGRDPELRSLPSGTSVCNFNLAVNDTLGEARGTSREMPTWFRVAVYGERAERCAKRLKKGSPVYVAGRLKAREWTDQKGTPRYTLEVKALDVRFFGAAESRTIRMP